MDRFELNQSTLSKHLKYLQHAGDLLDCPWLVRKGKHWDLTDEGRRVWTAVSEFVDRYQNLELFLEGTKGSPSSVRFARGQQTAARFVRKALREVRTPLSTTTRQQGQALQGLYDSVNGYRSTAATCLYRNGSDRGVAPGSGESRPVSTQGGYARIPRRSRPHMVPHCLSFLSCRKRPGKLL